MKRIYYFDETTGSYIGEGLAKPDPMQPDKALIPRNATETPPPGDRSVWKGDKWVAAAPKPEATVTVTSDSPVNLQTGDPVNLQNTTAPELMQRDGAPLSDPGDPNAEPDVNPAEDFDDEPETSETSETSETPEEPEATEAAEREAENLGVDLENVDGSGKDGRILVKDVEAAASEAEPETDAPAEPVEGGEGEPAEQPAAEAPKAAKPRKGRKPRKS